MPLPTLVLLPGLACDERLWEAQRPALPAGLDIRVSDAHMRHDRIETMAAAVLDENPGPLILCGASMGGMIAMEAARQAPPRTHGLALLGTNPRPETPDMVELRQSAIELFERGEARDVIELNAGFAFHRSSSGNAALLRRYVDMVLDAGAAQLVSQNRALMRRPDARPHLARLRCPVLVMCGDDDRLTPPECSREIAALIPHAELSWIAQCGHMLTMERPGAVNPGLKAWLQALLSAQPAAGPLPRRAAAPSGGSDPHAVGERGGDIQ
ncbi:MAG TPA: alpha/beta fold hydrolase [Variovorax sp.]